MFQGFGYLECRVAPAAMSCERTCTVATAVGDVEIVDQACRVYDATGRPATDTKIAGSSGFLRAYVHDGAGPWRTVSVWHMGGNVNLTVPASAVRAALPPAEAYDDYTI